MLEVYLGYCSPYAAFLDITSLNDFVSDDRQESGYGVIEVGDTLPCPHPGPEYDYLKSELVAKVGLFVEELPTDLKQVALLHYWDGLTQSQIAHQLGISQSAVSQRLSKVTVSGRRYFSVVFH